uniref:Uncharacterized protein n=1 Tax=Anguilla anguilla TaxID=7936 RepID=A0A0E9X1N8_ANGAN
MSLLSSLKKVSAIESTFLPYITDWPSRGQCELSSVEVCSCTLQSSPCLKLNCKS